MVVDMAKKDMYVRLLDTVLDRVAKSVTKSGDRELVLRPVLIHGGRNVILSNLKQIAEALNREPEHIARFMLKETGRAGAVEEDRLVIQGRITPEEVRRLIELYVKEFVKCPICGGIDTRLVSEKKFRFVVCEVCGAKNPVRKI
ncbi:MAG TPA: translation initiation factor IF-2 subunit beta [Candidatus Caldiarchaeum subterraneum]|uniref:Translation initiation factor IF-2 subunit beta n=1 Tax=Caldiarchaeum subterraneum TaxID=311458 RepID=A0A832ZU16_CALS0|nr:translation initiation factor IF-2 subunit beta [Candidatus Caldarchaeum subterraneum]